MMPDDAEQIAERATILAAQMPTMKEALGCMDCDLIFRSGGACPRCESKSLINVGQLLLGN